MQFFFFELLKNIDILSNGENFRFDMHVSSFSNMSYGIYTKKDDNNSFGITLKKDFMVLNQDLFNLKLDQPIKEYPTFNAQLITLINDEKSQISYDINHKFKSDHLNMGIGNTWFDIANQFDLTLGIHEQDKKLESEFYATFGDETMKFQIGLDQIKNSSNMYMFFNLKLENNLNKRNFGSNVIITSKENTFGLKKLSLKSFRKKNLDKLWKTYMNYN